MTNKIVHVIGGGTAIRTHIDSHLYVELGSEAKGPTAKRLTELCATHGEMDTKLHLTKMAGGEDSLKTNDDLKQLVLKLVDDDTTKIVFFNAAVLDFVPSFPDAVVGKKVGRLHTSDEDGNPLEYDYRLHLTPSEKLVKIFRQGGEGRKPRKDIFLVAFKQTFGATPKEQYRQGLNMLKRVSANLVLANDGETKFNMIIVPEEAAYTKTHDREAVLRDLVEMAYTRSKLHFTQTTEIPGKPVAWNSKEVPANLREVVDHCIARGAYKSVRGVTAGHFAVKVKDGEFLTSRRKTNFNDMENVGLVRVRRTGPHTMVAEGSKPSVGGISQDAIFTDHPRFECIVHAHVEPKPDSVVPTVPQKPYECGSHECGQNTSRGLKALTDDILAVNLGEHGFNFAFKKTTDAKKVIELIEKNFYLDKKSGGFDVETDPARELRVEAPSRDDATRVREGLPVYV